MKKTEVSLILGPSALKRIQNLAMDKGRPVEEEAAILLEKGIHICETKENPEKSSGKKGHE